MFKVIVDLRVWRSSSEGEGGWWHMCENPRAHAGFYAIISSVRTAIKPQKRRGNTYQTSVAIDGLETSLSRKESILTLFMFAKNSIQIRPSFKAVISSSHHKNI